MRVPCSRRIQTPGPLSGVASHRRAQRDTHTQVRTDSTRAGVHTWAILPRDLGTHACTHTLMHTHVHAQTHMGRCAHMGDSTQRPRNTRTHTLVHTHVHVYTHSPRLPHSVPSKDEGSQSASAGSATHCDPGEPFPQNTGRPQGLQDAKTLETLEPHFLTSPRSLISHPDILPGIFPAVSLSLPMFLNPEPHKQFPDSCSLSWNLLLEVCPESGAQD